MSRISCLVSSNFLLTVSRRCSRRSFSIFRQEQCDSSSETYNSRATRVNEKKNALRVTGILFGILSHYATPSTKTHFKYMKNHIISSIPNIYGLINDPHNDFLLGWPDSSTGGALHQHRRGQGSKPRSGLNILGLSPCCPSSAKTLQ